MRLLSEIIPPYVDHCTAESHKFTHFTLAATEVVWEILDGL
jgi:hypothetical protein